MKLENDGKEKAATHPVKQIFLKKQSPLHTWKNDSDLENRGKMQKKNKTKKTTHAYFSAMEIKLLKDLLTTHTLT